MKVQFISLGSGSSGNCYYLGYNGYGILIDAGIGVRSIKKRLKAVGIPMESVSAVFVTHDHADHVKSVGVLGEKMFIPIYATELAHRGINGSYCVTEKLHSSVRYIEKGSPLRFHDFTIEAFEVPHDATDCVGYCVTVGGKTFCFATDLGEITDTAARYIVRANYLVIEANYDEHMLEVGPYPAYLKSRIKSRTGHLCNSATAEFLATHFTDHLRNIWLCHLSHTNNTPDAAYATVANRLAEGGIIVGRDVELTALSRTSPSALYEFDV